MTEDILVSTPRNFIMREYKINVSHNHITFNFKIE